MNWRRTARFSAVALCLALCPAVAAQAPADPIALINRGLVSPGTKDASETLFTAVAKMQPPPTLPKTLREVSLLTSKSRGWSDWDSWAKAEPQQAALAALKSIGDPKSKYTLGLPYGRSDTKPEWVAAGLYIDLGDPPLLAAAPTGLEYLKRLDHLAMLCTVQGQRLALEKKPAECAGVLVDWLRLGRIIADRPFTGEKTWGLNHMTWALERLGDIACTHADLFDEKSVQDVNKDLDFRAIAPERIRFPFGERMALEQLVSLAIDERGGPKADAFGPTLARITYNRANPYDLFAQAAYWGEIGKSHAGWFDTRDQIDKSLGDWQKRWELNDIFDLIMQTPTDYSKMDRLKFALVDQMVRPVGGLFGLRTSFVTQLGGMRSALAVVGYRSVQKQWPPNLNAVQPRFVQKLDEDPWFYERERRVHDIYRYFVPMRDMPVGPRELPKPHPITVSHSAGASAAPPANAALPALPGGVVSAEVAAKAQQRAARAFASAPPGMFDLDKFMLDIPKFRQWLIETSLRETNEEVAAELTDDLARFAETGITSENVEAKLAEAFGSQAGASSNAFAPDEEEKPAFDVKKIQRAITDAAKALLSEPTVVKSIAAAKAGQTLSVEEAKAFQSALFGTAIQPAYLDPLMDAGRTFLAGPLGEPVRQQIRQAMDAAAEAAAAANSGQGPPPFATSLTDADFVLYSVGPDMKANFARSVSPGGPDILVWPPVLTLERRAASPN